MLRCHGTQTHDANRTTNNRQRTTKQTTTNNQQPTNNQKPTKNKRQTNQSVFSLGSTSRHNAETSASFEEGLLKTKHTLTVATVLVILAFLNGASLFILANRSSIPNDSPAGYRKAVWLETLGPVFVGLPAETDPRDPLNRRGPPAFR